MSKNTKSFPGQPVLAQIFSLISRDLVSKIVSEGQYDRYYKKFKTHDHLLSMLYCVVSGSTSLREVVTGLMAFGTRLKHLGLKYFPRRSTLSEANTNRNSEVFGKIYYALLQRYLPVLPDSRGGHRFLKDLYVIDSSTISLFKAILKCVGRKPKSGRSKGGIKVHVMMKFTDLLPHFIKFSSASRHDRRFLDHINLKKGAIVAFDKAYNDYKLFAKWSQKGIRFVTRMKKNAVFSVVETFGISSLNTGIILKDQLIELDLGAERDPLRLRRIEYYDETMDKTLVFLSNILDLNADKVALIYKCRWEIECLFKRLKQNFPLKYFLGDTPNALEIQIWVSLIANLLYEVISKGLSRRWAFSNMCSMIRIHLASYINLWVFLNDPEASWRKICDSGGRQLSLFEDG